MKFEKKERIIYNLKMASLANNKILAMGINHPKFLSMTIAIHGWEVDYKNFFLKHFNWK